MSCYEGTVGQQSHMITAINLKQYQFSAHNGSKDKRMLNCYFSPRHLNLLFKEEFKAISSGHYSFPLLPGLKEHHVALQQLKRVNLFQTVLK